MYCYRAYGLNLASNLELPDLLPTEAIPDVTIRLIDETVSGIPDTYQGDVHLDPQEATFFNPRVGRFTFHQGKEVIVQPTPQRNLELIRLHLVNGMMHIVLFQRGTLVLHGSAIAIQGQAVGFIGASGRGKSSIAAALYQRGHRLFSDDVIPIHVGTTEIEVFPGYPQVKVSEEVAECLGYDASIRIATYPEEGEASFQAQRSFLTSPLPLKQIYILEPSDTIAVSPLSAREAMIVMMQNALPTMCNLPQTAEQFLQVTKLANSVPFYRLQRSQNLTELPDLAELVEVHVLDCLTALVH